MPNARHTPVLVAVLAGALLVPSTDAAPDAYRDLVDADNPILWYRMGEPAGSLTIANDGTLGASHDTDVIPGITLGQPTAAGDTAALFAVPSLPFLESNAPAPASMTGNPSFTAEIVVFLSSSGQTIDYPPFLHWGAPSPGRSVFFSLRSNDPNRVFCGFYNGGMTAECTMRLDDWNHIVWVRDSGGGANDAFTGSTLFVNGVEEDLVPDTFLSGFPGVPDVTATTFRVQRSTDRFRYFDGVVDEIVLYDAPLAAEQVEDRFDSLQLSPPVICAADLDGNCGILDLTDVNLFVAGFLDQDPVSDLNSDGVWDLTDVNLFITSFLAGCP